MPTDFKTVAIDTEETLHDFASFMRRTRTIRDYEHSELLLNIQEYLKFLNDSALDYEQAQARQ